MSYQIDQSGKVEQTNVDTVICLANGKSTTILVRAKVKRQLQEIFRRRGQIRNYVLFTFCSLISIIIKNNHTVKDIEVDKEYFGREAIIKEIILEMLKKLRSKPEISFTQIGRKVKAHEFAYKTYTRHQKPNKIAKLDELLTEIKLTEVGKRLKNT